MRGFLRIVLFVVLGPYLGLAMMSLTIGTYTYATNGSMRDFVLPDDLLTGWLLVVIYAIGFVPALLSGIVAIFLSRAVSGWRYWLWMAVVGAVPCVLLALLMTTGGPEMMGKSGELPLLIGMTLAGAVAASLCAALFDAGAWLAGDRKAA